MNASIARSRSVASGGDVDAGAVETGRAADLRADLRAMFTLLGRTDLNLNLACGAFQWLAQMTRATQPRRKSSPVPLIGI
jgi:hypothetical protein